MAAIIGLPFFFLPLIVHFPVYAMGRFGARLVEDEEETQAQNKITFGLLSMLLMYGLSFFFLWALFWYTPMGAVLAASLLYLFARYHNQMIDGKLAHNNFRKELILTDLGLVITGNYERLVCCASRPHRSLIQLLTLGPNASSPHGECSLGCGPLVDSICPWAPFRSL